MHRVIQAVQGSAVPRLAASIIGAVILAEMLVVWLPMVWCQTPETYTELQRDVYENYYLGGRAVLEGTALYRPYPEYGPYVLDKYPLISDKCFSSPPLVYVASAPLATLPFPVFAHVWYVLVLVGVLVYAACLGYLATGRVTWLSFSVAISLLMCLPGTVPAMTLGNIDPVLWALFGLALAAARLRGGLFAAVALVKVHTLWPLAVASWHDRARVYAPAALVLLAGVLIGALAPGGLWAWVDWARYTAPNIPAQGTFNHANVSISFAGLRLARLLGWHYTAGPLPPGARLYLTAMGLAAPLITTRLVRRLEHALQYACITTSAVLFAPLCWEFYLAYSLAAVMLAYRSVVGAAEERAERDGEDCCGQPERL